jgi:CheY-like chemotaxis protein
VRMQAIDGTGPFTLSDSQSCRLLLSRQPTSQGRNRHAVRNGILGFRVARRERPSVIISDYFMPRGDVNFLLWRLRSTPGTEKIPVFVMRGRSLNEPTEANLWRNICGGPGAARIFKKPFESCHQRCEFVLKSPV